MKTTHFKQFSSIDSTNKYLKENHLHLEDRTLVSAKIQTQGRGRFDRIWQSFEEGNAYFSILLKPECEISQLPLVNLTQYVSVKLAEKMKMCGIEANIKWPNDLLVDGKKIAGILSEAVISKGIVKAVILGVGVNLNMSKETLDSIDKPATSLGTLLNKQIDVTEFIEDFSEMFFDELDSFMINGFDLIKKRYVQRCSFIDTEVLIRNLNDEKKGLALGINDDGSLLLKTENNRENIYVGDLL